VHELLESKIEKILLIRMLSSADVCAIGLPVLRYFQKILPDAEIHFLTFGDGTEIIKLAEPSVYIHHVTQQQWPDDFFLAMESFLGLAEQIIGENYSQIINLDITFMPCFLARFLSDAGEPVSGNYLNMSVQQLLQQVQDKILQADYVNSTQAFMASSFVNMHKWFGPWWQFDAEYEGGYPEFYLTKCCGLVDDKLDQGIVVIPDKKSG
jgi:ADP-heptose:LPS heptosyltransferase